ncbi:hypothetical protein [Deinococcus depolymerans]|uniref:Transposase n=1 Tax=Deinococcus depolymerans TaxID=392408 RepID=A0ABN1C7E4_9DEIO
MPRTPSLPHSIITAQLNRITSLSGLVPYSPLRKSAISQEMARDSFASTKDLQRRARNAPEGAFLAIDFVMVPHAGRTMGSWLELCPTGNALRP